MLTLRQNGGARAHAAATDVALQNVNRYQYPRLRVFRAEEKIFADLMRPGMQVLDLGCGSGRILRALAMHSVNVCACDLNFAALEQLRTSYSVDDLIGLEQADARSLPFSNESFDVVIFAFNGIDFLYPESERIIALREIGRVLRPGGYFLLSTHNPLGTLLSPRGLRSRVGWRWRFTYAFSGAVRQSYFRNHDGLRLYHALPKRVALQVSEHTGATFLYCLTRSAVSRSMAFVTLFSAWPYYVFRRKSDDAAS